MTDSLPPFDDAPLKQAIRASIAGHTAPASLRERIARQMAAEPVDGESDASRQSIPLRNPRKQFFLRIAAVLLIGMGGSLIAVEMYDQFGDRPTPTGTSGSYAQPGLWKAMVAVHDARGSDVAQDNEPLKASLTDPAALAAEASARLQRYVPVPRFRDSKDAWTIDGASFCKVVGLASVQFDLQHDGKRITILSMPGSAWTAPPTDNYSTKSGENAIAGYVKEGGLHCVVGDRGMSVGDVEGLVQQLRVQ